MFGPHRFRGPAVQLRDDGVGFVMFNRPERLNAVTAQSFADLETALRRFGADSSCGAVVIGGEGAAFCAGHGHGGPPAEARRRPGPARLRRHAAHGRSRSGHARHPTTRHCRGAGGSGGSRLRARRGIRRSSVRSGREVHGTLSQARGLDRRLGPVVDAAPPDRRRCRRGNPLHRPHARRRGGT